MFGNWLKIDKNKFDNKISNFNKVCKCPYCENVPDKKEVKKFKCKNCNKLVFVKKVNDNRYFLTDSDYNEFVRLKKFDLLKNKYFNTLINNGYEQIELENSFTKKNINTIDDLKKFIWASFNDLLFDEVKNNKEKSSLYFSMSYYSADERNGEDVYKFNKLGHDSKLQDFVNSVSNAIDWDVMIMSSPKFPECYKDDQKKIPFEEMLKNPILPHNVSNSKYGCMCVYTFKARRDDNGNLIYNLI